MGDGEGKQSKCEGGGEGKSRQSCSAAIAVKKTIEVINCN